MGKILKKLKALIFLGIMCSGTILNAMHMNEPTEKEKALRKELFFEADLLSNLKEAENKFLKQTYLDLRSHKGRTVLSQPLVSNLLPTLEYLLEKMKLTALVNVPDNDGFTAIYEARSPAAARLLIKHGALVNVATVGGLTPLIKAIIETNYELVRLLIEEGGANVDKNTLRSWLKPGATTVNIQNYLTQEFNKQRGPSPEEQEQMRREAQQREELRRRQEARQRAEQEARRRAQEEEQRRAQEEARRRAQEEEQRKAQEEARRRQQQDEARMPFRPSPAPRLSVDDLIAMGISSYNFYQLRESTSPSSHRQLAYMILELPDGADQRQITAAYRKKALKWHPDKQSGKSDYIQLINWAKDLLTQ